MKTLTILLKIFLFVVLLLLPLGGRWFWYYHGSYEKPAIATIDPARISMSTETYRSYNDQPQPGKGRVIIDLTHSNNLLIDDLSPLKARLAVRGIEVETFDSASQDSLATRLRGATALVELVPSDVFGAEERQVIVDFVNDGGRLLLAADPTRPVPAYQEPGNIDLTTVFYPESAIPAVNSLASAFGVSFFEDYVYNLTNYDGNYRNVQFHVFAKDSPLTQGLGQVTLFAAHSMRGEGLPLIQGDESTLSNLRTGETGFVSAMLAADGKVLALGDITFMTSPYYLVTDNDHFLSNIADWLATDSRQWDLMDFPYLFSGPVDLIQTFSGTIDPRLIAQSTPLQQLFKQSGIPLELRTKANPEHDSFYVGTYGELAGVQGFLTAANITITFTSTTKTAAVVMTPTPNTTNRQNPKTGGKTADTIAVKDVGVFIAHGTSLFIVNRSANHVSLIVLAEDGQAVLTAVERLLSANFDGCVSQQDVTICSTGEVQIPETPVPQETATPSTPVEPVALKKVLILSVDNGLSGKRNDASEMEKELTSLYNVTVWSITAQGNPTESDLAGYDAYIVDTGDYAYDDQIGKVLNTLNNLSNVLLIGEQPLPVDGQVIITAPIDDLVVTDAQHPLAFMFTDGETIPLSASESGNPAVVLPKDLFSNTNTSTVVFERGSSSKDAGAPAVFAGEDNTGQRYVIATFAFYRLPEDKQLTFILNTVKWLVKQ